MGPRQLIPLLWWLFLWLPLSDDVGPGLLGPSAAAALLLRDGVVRRRLRGRNVDLMGRKEPMMLLDIRLGCAAETPLLIRQLRIHTT